MALEVLESPEIFSNSFLADLQNLITLNKIIFEKARQLI
jgi:hypothetical protein